MPGLCEESVKKLLRDCPVVELIKGAGETDWLYNAGEADEMCTLIIQGKLEIRAGRQGQNLAGNLVEFSCVCVCVCNLRDESEGS